MSTESRTITDPAACHADRLALTGDDGAWTYGELLASARRVAGALLAGAADLAGAPVAYLVPPRCGHVAVQWGIWLAGGVAVPLCLQHPAAELAHVLDDSGAATVVVDPDHAASARAHAADHAGRRWLTVSAALKAAPAVALPPLAPARPAMIIYTSGTTGRPKGAVLGHGHLVAQVRSLAEAWRWRPDDRILSVLPLHHVHGIVNVVGCALFSGACCDLLPRFDAAEVWRRLIAGGGLSLFMAVPTVYSHLIDAWEAAPAARREAMSAGCRRLRLMVSGSAALPVSLLDRWRQVSGHVLLERYGMTEIGMALSNPLIVGARRPGRVGMPLPGVEVRLADVDPQAGGEGELLVRGPGVFAGYWRRPEQSARAFVDGDWFATGDVAERDPADGSYRIVGRRSVDIIKTGGYKVSALEIEERLREHPSVADCAVVGLVDHRWGQLVAAAVVPAAGASLEAEALRAWCASVLAPYKVPRRWALDVELPRNALGKVRKPELARRLEVGQRGGEGG